MTRAPVPRLVPILALALALPAAAHAQTKVGTTFGDFLLIEPSARVAAMGNAGVTLDLGIEGAYFNPASIGRIGSWTVQFDHAAWLADMGYDYVAVGIPFGKWGNGLVSVTHLGSGEMDVRTVTQPLGTGETFDASDLAVGLGYGLEITDRFTAGGQVSFAQERIWHSSAGTMVFNFGGLYRTSENGLRLGASLSNFGIGAQFSGRDLFVLYDQDPSRYGDNNALPADAQTDAFAVPVLFRAGLGQSFRTSADTRLDVVVDAFHPNNNTESISLGTELEIRRLLALRAGYQNLFLQDSEVGLTLGAGIVVEQGGNNYHFDYGWADQGRLGSTHRFGLGMKF